MEKKDIDHRVKYNNNKNYKKKERFELRNFINKRHTKIRGNMLQHKLGKVNQARYVCRNGDLVKYRYKLYGTQLINTPENIQSQNHLKNNL